MAEITKCPPGTAKNASLHQWQFGPGAIEPADIGSARRPAVGDFTPCERAVLEIVLEKSGDIPQRDPEALLSKQIGASCSLVYASAQRLAKHGTICRKKIGRQWHYARPGHHWLRPRQ
jgi:uncharacterized membrane protein